MSVPSIVIEASPPSPHDVTTIDEVSEPGSTPEAAEQIKEEDKILEEDEEKEEATGEEDTEDDDVVDGEDDDDLMAKLRKRRQARKLKALMGKMAEDDSEENDTDLEEEKEHGSLSFDPSGEKVYFETCKELGVVPVSYFVRHMRDTELRMKHHGLGPNGVRALAVPLVANTSVTTLDLEDNWLEAEGGIYVADMLKENCYISDLNLANNRLGSAGGRAMCDMLINFNTSLRSLNLSGNNLTDGDIELFATILLENNRLRELNLSHNDFGDGAGSILGHAIGENESLEILDLSWNHFRHQSGIAILDGIRASSRLKKVNVSWNGFGNEGSFAASDILKNNNVLLDLDLSSNRIGLDGITAIAKGLEANETMVSLSLGQNPMTSVGALQIINAINNERSVLKSLNLAEVWVDKEFNQIVQDMKESRQIEVKYGGILSNYVIKAPIKKPPRLSKKSVEELVQEEEDIWETLLESVEKHRAPLIRYVEQYDPDFTFKVTLQQFISAVKQVNLGLDEDQLNILSSKLEEAVAVDGMVDYSMLDY